MLRLRWLLGTAVQLHLDELGSQAYGLDESVQRSQAISRQSAPYGG